MSAGRHFSLTTLNPEKANHYFLLRSNSFGSVRHTAKKVLRNFFLFSIEYLCDKLKQSFLYTFSKSTGSKGTCILITFYANAFVSKFFNYSFAYIYLFNFTLTKNVHLFIHSLKKLSTLTWPQTSSLMYVSLLQFSLQAEKSVYRVKCSFS